MRNDSEKVIQYVMSGYSINSCTRSGTDRILKLNAPVLKLFSSSVRLGEAEYRSAMNLLVDYLVQSYASGIRIDIRTSHYGQEWVEIQDKQGHAKSKLALSARTMQVLKQQLATCTPPPIEADLRKAPGNAW